MTPDPFAERLARFTPEAGGLDTAAILFLAGRASVRARRLWPALAGMLALSQALTLAVLFSRSPNETAPLTPARRTLHDDILVPESPEPPLGSVRWLPRVEYDSHRPAATLENIVQPDPPIDVLATRAGLRTGKDSPVFRID